jgi:hypothetical protein
MLKIDLDMCIMVQHIVQNIVNPHPNFLEGRRGLNELGCWI